MRKIWFSFVLAGFFAMGCRPDPEVGDALCSDQIDNDEDGTTDCADPGCIGVPSCTQEICNNGIDDDENGQQDCADAACAANPACVESNCGDNIDNDNDTDVDCDDSDCAANPACQPNDCGNNVIDAGEDCDGAQLGGEDCTTIPGGFTGGNLACDANCNFNTAGCQGGAVEICDNNIDDDGDTFVDCDDFGCDGDPACPVVQEDNCTNNLDDDGDTFIDCDDFDCGADPACNTEICDNNIDDDGDTFVDCDDFGCDNDPACAPDAEDDEAACTNGQDDDADGFADCVDRGCDVAATCIALEDCDDNIDNDLDGRVDCVDGSCTNNAACNAGAATIQDVQDGTIASGATVTINNVFVTAVRGANNLNAFVQAPDGVTDNGHTYPEFAGVQLFIQGNQLANFPDAANLQIGDCVSFTGVLKEFNASTEVEMDLTEAATSAFTKNANPASCGTAPSAITLNLTDIATDTDPNTADEQPGLDAESFEAVLIRVVTVTASNATDANGDFVVTTAGLLANLLIENFLFSTNNSPIPATQGQAFSSITGIYNEFTNANDQTKNYRLQPRNAADLQ